MSLEELIVAARKMDHSAASLEDDVRCFEAILDEKSAKFEEEARAQVADEEFLARTYTL